MYNVFGYEVDIDGYIDFNYYFNNFIEAVKTFKEISNNPFMVVMIQRETTYSCHHVNGVGRTPKEFIVKPLK